MENIKFWEAGNCGLKIFGPEYQKVHLYAKSGGINRLTYLAVALFKCYIEPRKKVGKNAHRNFKSSIILCRYRKP